MPLTVWRFLDGNRAHEKQSAALVRGLDSSYGGQLNCVDIPLSVTAHGIVMGLAKGLSSLPRPDFHIGTGRRTRLPMLAARYRYGGRAVAINRPQFPFRWFDFAIVPEHDRPPPLENVILSQGALTGPLPGNAARPGCGLILLGGPSRHFCWDDGPVRRQVEQLLSQPLDWYLSNSRRTPEGLLESIAGREAHLVDWRSCSPDWVHAQMAAAEQIWVSEDSISMLFESLQSRARVGIIRVPCRSRANKVRAAVQRLVDQGVVGERWEEVIAQSERVPLDQYLVCARALLRRCGLSIR
ncbi:ELM1/GtrOC1 family putative glycosyltransferase [Microbulbifer sp. 2205BS26-8]|uniref:ELM1/GtrOC1 family putative glycosyltransferase n=1 Tax=Microbulbifer sp. 2205BS26-8 TaxID=3064386 RepID=UPI00273F7E1B|nr:ELM1/GtrOC1 family putative glycosyltransferase [Microbulbifer sp. 2205BS26-8]MDP5208486.1 ELM1/GtrOC1 family putative glycosyltransferase [Microbulbifer sp. 2205BS26-8]